MCKIQWNSWFSRFCQIFKKSVPSLRCNYEDQIDFSSHRILDLSSDFSTSQERFSKISFCWTENSTFLAAGLKFPKNRPCWTGFFIILPKFSPAGLDFQSSVWKIYQKSSFFQSSKPIFRSRFWDLNFGSKKSHFDGFFDLDFFSILRPKTGNFGTSKNYWKIKVDSSTLYCHRVFVKKL